MQFGAILDDVCYPASIAISGILLGLSWEGGIRVFTVVKTKPARFCN